MSYLEIFKEATTAKILNTSLKREIHFSIYYINPFAYIIYQTNASFSPTSG